MDANIVVKGRMAELFPHDHPATPWLIRLMIIRDDLEYEFRNILLNDEPTAHDYWRCTYFLRRMSISLLEARAVLSFEGGKESKRAKDDLMLAFAPDLQATVAVLDDAAEVLEPLRNAVGAHLRPQNADPQGDGVEARVLRNFPMLEGEAEFCLSDFQRSNCRSLTVNALLFAWPDVDSDEGYRERHQTMRDAIISSVNRVIWAIDGLLIRHWWNLGLVKLPPGYDLGARDPKTGMFVRVPSRPEARPLPNKPLKQTAAPRRGPRRPTSRPW